MENNGGIGSLIKTAASGWSNDNASTHSGSLAYSTMLSIAPLLIIAIGISGLFFGPQASRGEIFSTLQGFLGASGAQAIEDMVKSSAQHPHTGLIATVVGAVTLLVGASSVFSQLQTSLNLIWNVRIKPSLGIWAIVRQRLLTFSMVVVIAFLLLVSLVMSAAVSAIGKFFSSRLPGGEGVWHAVNFILPYFVITAVFAAIYKVLPDVKLRWRDVGIGAAATAFFFSIGKTLIGLYLGKSSVASSYGAAGSLIVVLIWVYYSSAILFFGAEFTRAFVTRNGGEIVPSNDAELMTTHPLTDSSADQKAQKKAA